MYGAAVLGLLNESRCSILAFTLFLLESDPCSFLNDQFVKSLSDSGYKSIAATGNRDNVVVLVAAFAQLFPQVGDVRREVAFLDDRTMPNLRHQIVLLYQLAVAFYQRKQR